MKKPWWLDGVVTPLTEIAVSIAFGVHLVLFGINGKQLHFQWAVLLGVLLIWSELVTLAREVKK